VQECRKRKGVVMMPFSGYNYLEVIDMAVERETELRQKAVQIIDGLSEERVAVAIQVLEIIAGASEEISNFMDFIALKVFEASCDEEDLTLEEKDSIHKGEAEIKAGLGVKADDVWKELGL
jgi:hypothetical protein